MSEVAEMIELPPADTALATYQKPQGLDPYIQKIRDEVKGHVADVSTRKGREAIASLAFKVRKSKTALDRLGKDLVDDLKDVPKKIDAERKRMREALDALADEVRQPLTEWEQAEEARITRHKTGIEMMQNAANTHDFSAATIRETIASVEAVVIDESWEEFEAEAHRSKAKTIEALTAALGAREKHEAEQAELARLRAEAEARRIQDEKDRIAREAAERAKHEAEEAARAEREAAAQREAQAKADAERAEREKREAIERQKQAEERAEAERLASIERAKQAAEAARLAEIERQRQEQARIEAEQKRRETDRKHKGAINAAAMEALVARGIPADYAKAVVIAIVQGEIPAVRIHY